MGVIPAIPENVGKNVGENVGNGSPKVHQKQKAIWRCPSIYWYKFFRIGQRLKPVGIWPDIGGNRHALRLIFYFAVTFLILFENPRNRFSGIVTVFLGTGLNITIILGL